MKKDITLSADRLSRKFGDKTAVDQVSMSIESGEIYGFLGPNGAGKSTTVKMLIGLLSPTSGTATVCGLDLRDNTDDIRLQIGAALQEISLDDKQTGREILDLQGRLYGLSNAQIKSRIDELADLIDIGPALDKRVGTYSGGMKRRVDLAAALVHNPELLFLDEPTTGLDPISRQKVWAEVRKLNEEYGVTIFLTTQYLEEADELADRVGIINRGQLVAEDTPAKLKTRVGNDIISLDLGQETSKAKVSIEKLEGVQSINTHGKKITIHAENAAELLQAVVTDLSKQNIELKGIDVRQSSLDDVFIAIAGDTDLDDTEAAS